MYRRLALAVAWILVVVALSQYVQAAPFCKDVVKLTTSGYVTRSTSGRELGWRISDITWEGCTMQCPEGQTLTHCGQGSSHVEESGKLNHIHQLTELSFRESHKGENANQCEVIFSFKSFVPVAALNDRESGIGKTLIHSVPTSGFSKTCV